MIEDKDRDKEKFPFWFLDINKIDEILTHIAEDLMKYLEGPLSNYDNTYSIQSNKKSIFEICNENQPLIDIIEDENYIKIYVELPGVKRNEINIRALENEVIIIVKSRNIMFSRSIPLSSKIDPQSSTARFRNGVLEVKLKKEKSLWRKMIEII